MRSLHAAVHLCPGNRRARGPGPGRSVARRELADDDPAADPARRQPAPLDLAAQLLPPLAHASQPQAVRPRARVAADAVIEDGEVEPVLLDAEVDVDPACLRVRD